MEKFLSQAETDSLTSEFTYRDNKSGMIGGYCENGFPFYYADAAMAEMLGYESVDELAAAIGGFVANTIHPDDMGQVERDLGGRFYEGMTYETTYRMPRRDGSWFWTIDRGKVVRAEDGRLAILSVCTDMSDFVRRQKELEAKDAWSDYLFRSLPGGYVRCAADENISFLYISERFLGILGWTEDEIRTEFDNSFTRLVHPDDRSAVREYSARILSGDMDGVQENIIYRLLGRSGYRWVSDTTMKAVISGQTLFQCLISDVTSFIYERDLRQRKLEDLLRASEERYEIIHALSVVYQEISLIDLERNTYRLVSGNGPTEQYQDTTGPIEEFRHYVIDRILVPEQRAEAEEFLNFSTAPARLADRQFVAREFKGRNGSWYLVTLIVKNRNDAGAVTHLLVSARNIDDQKTKELEYQRTLRETAEEARRASAAKSNFLSRMSHDIRTPINAIVGLLKIDEAHFDDQALLRSNHEKMIVSADHLLSLINDVLQMSKLEDGDTVLTHEFISLVDLTRDIVTIVIGRAVDAGIVWDYEKGKEVIPYPYIYGSPLHLRQIFLNIYGNCIKYTRPGGRIRTVVEALEDRGGQCVYRWTISDTGVGMSQEFVKRIFEPFAQEKTDARSVYQGTGLGMAIVKSLVEKMNGTIEVESELGVGSTFIVTIPFDIAPEPSALPAAEDEQPHDIRGLRLLLAEDNELNAEIAEMLLHDEGAEITVAHDGRQALERFASSEPGTYDAILMDVMMPVMDGMAATRAIRACGHPDAADVPIIAMTANAFREDAERCIASGMNAHLAKPIEVGRAVTVIAQCCEKRRRG